MCQAKTGPAVMNVLQQVGFRSGKFYPQMLWGSPRARVLLACLEPGQTLPAYEDPAELLVYVIEGAGRIRIGDEEHAVQAGCLAAAPPGALRGLTAGARMVALLVHLSDDGESTA